MSDQIAQMLSGYDDATWNRLRKDRRRTYQRAAETLILDWEKFVVLVRPLRLTAVKRDMDELAVDVARNLYMDNPTWFKDELKQLLTKLR